MNFVQYHVEAYKLVFKKGLMNLVKLLLFSVILILSLAVPVLTPIAMIASVSFFKAFLEKGEADLFETLKGVDMTADRYLRLLIASLLQIVVIAAGFALFFIPGIIFAFSLAPLFYIITEKPDMTTSEAFKSSFEVMNGNKVNLFMLRLLGAVVPLGISLVIAIFARLVPFIGMILSLGYVLIMPLIFAEIMIVDIMFFKEIFEKKVSIEPEVIVEEKPVKNAKLPKSVEAPNTEITFEEPKEPEQPKE